MTNEQALRDLRLRHAVRLFSRHARPSALRVIAIVMVLALSPLTWAAFAVNSFMSDATLSTKFLRLQNLVPTDQFYAEVCYGSYPPPLLGERHFRQFSFFSPPILLALVAADGLSIDGEVRDRMRQNQFLLRLETFQQCR